MNEPRTLFEKIWQAHVVAPLDGTNDLLHVDRHLLHEVSSPQAFRNLDERGLKVRHPELTFAVEDHIISTAPGRTADSFAGGIEFVRLIRENCTQHNIRRFGIGDPHQGIVHVVAPELGIALPGVTLVCSDSHTGTVGALGTLAWGIGTSEVVQVLATQSLVQARPKLMRIDFNGELPPGVGAKDLVLFLIGRHGTALGTGYGVEFAGSAIRRLSMEGRFTICNMSIEFGTRFGLIAPDETTFKYVAGRSYSPSGAVWENAVAAWRSLPSDPGARYDKVISIDCDEIGPQITWGTAPDQVISIDQSVPDPEEESDAGRRESIERALSYMGLRPGVAIEGLPIDVVFIGSCTNGRLSDLREAAVVAQGKRVAQGVRAIVVPGSQVVKLAAEAEGLDKVFADAGFEWRAAGCSMCVSINDDRVPEGARCVSTSNRNFEGRQGPRSRTHLASPASAAAAAIAGRIADIRDLKTAVWM